MKKIIALLVLFFISYFNEIKANENLVSSLKEGGKLVFIRHAYAPGNGDPNNFNLKDCFSQRNLSQEGINQSRKIGIFFINNQIPIDKILSSEWCRCKDTAKYAFSNYITFDALNSFYDKKFFKNKKKQIKDLKNYIQNWDSKKNLILVTHYVVISEISNVSASSGEIIVLQKNFNLIGTIKINK